MVCGAVETCCRPLDRLPDNLPPVQYPRTAGRIPDDAEDPLRAWHVISTIKGSRRGKLSGKTVAIKDNIGVAGLPMMNGASVLQGRVPEAHDLSVVRCLCGRVAIMNRGRIVEQGATEQVFRAPRHDCTRALLAAAP